LRLRKIQEILVNISLIAIIIAIIYSIKTTCTKKRMIMYIVHIHIYIYCAFYFVLHFNKMILYCMKNNK